jgi:hypothetical protein
VHFYNIIVKKGLFKRIRIRPLVTFRAHLQQPASIAQCFPIQDISIAFHCTIAMFDPINWTGVQVWRCVGWVSRVCIYLVLGVPGLATCWTGVTRRRLLGCIQGQGT